MGVYTNEQQNILTHIQQGYNIITRAVAGSGKTTTCKCIIEGCPDKKILILMFNRRLAQETKLRFKHQNESGKLEVSTLHSFVTRNYLLDCSTDEGLYFLLEEELPLPEINDKDKERTFDLIICDEAQDYSSLNVKVINKLIVDFHIPQMMIMGDEHQCIYQFREANPDYLIHAEKYFHLENWINLTLTNSFRVPENICSLIRKYSSINIHSASPNIGKIKYLSLPMFNKFGYNECASFLSKTISKLLRGGYSLSDIAVLSHSLKLSKYAPITQIVNALNKKNWFIHIASEDSNDEPKLSRGKILFSTFHSFKGQERKVIFLLGVDSFLGNFMEVKEEIPNVLYVALTRCTEKLYIIQNDKSNPLKYFEEFAPVCEVQDEGVYVRSDTYNITDLIRFQPSEKIRAVKKLCDIKLLQKSNKFRFNRVVKFSRSYEDVSSLWGELVMFYHRYLYDRDGLMEETEYYIDEITSNKFLSQEEIDEIESEEDVVFLAMMSNLISCYRKGIIHPLKQIEHYDWIQTNRLDKTQKYLTELQDECIEYEKSIACDIDHFSIVGKMDAYNPETGVIYEIKFVSALTLTHVLQLICYICVMYVSQGILCPGILLNTMTGEKYQITISEKYAETILRMLLAVKT